MFKSKRVVWFEYVMRMDDYTLEFLRELCCGRQKLEGLRGKKWIEDVKEDMKIMGI